MSTGTCGARDGATANDYRRARALAVRMFRRGLFPIRELEDCAQEIALALYQGHSAKIACFRAIDYLRSAGVVSKHNYQRGMRLYFSEEMPEIGGERAGSEQEHGADDYAAAVEYLERLLALDAPLVLALCQHKTRRAVARRYQLSEARISQKVTALKQAARDWSPPIESQ